MPTKSLFLLDTLASGAQHLSVQDGGTAPTTANMTTGWVVGTTAANNYSAMDSQTKRAATTFSTTVIPASAVAPDNTLGDCWVAGPFNGTFAAASWTLAFNMIGVSRTDAGTGAITLRVWKGTNVTGSGATEQTSALQTGSTASVMTTAAAATSTVTWSASQMVCQGEFVFVKVAFKIVVAGSNSVTDTVFRAGSASVITTSDFSPSLQRARFVNQAVKRAAFV